VIKQVTPPAYYDDPTSTQRVKDRIVVAATNRLASLELLDRVEVEAGNNSLLVKLDREPDARLMIALNEMRLVLDLSVRIKIAAKPERALKKNEIPLLFPDWITAAYQSSEIASRDAGRFVERAIAASATQQAPAGINQLAQKIQTAATEFNVPVEINTRGNLISFTIMSSREVLGDPQFNSFLEQIAKLKEQGIIIQGLFHPTIDAANSRFFELSTGQRVPSSIVTSEPDRTVLAALKDNETAQEISKQLFEDTGWTVGQGDPLELPNSAHPFLIAEPEYSPRSLEEATFQDLNQIQWAVPDWLALSEPEAFDRFVVLKCIKEPPTRYRENLSKRLESTGIPVILASSPNEKQFKLDSPQLDFLIQRSLPSDCYVRDLGLNEDGELLVSLYAPERLLGEIATLQDELNRFLVGAEITDRTPTTESRTEVSQVEVTAQEPSVHLARMFRRSGPVYGALAARIGDADGYLRGSNLAEDPVVAAEKIETHFKRVVFPYQNYPSSFPSNTQWNEHRDGQVEWIDASAAFAIDSSGARFCEDAFSAAALPKGGWIITAHIARVSRFVIPGSDLDEFAKTRVLATYPKKGGETVWNLPRRFLLENVGYSPGAFRPSWTITMQISAEGELQAGSIRETNVRVGQQLSFSQADELLGSDQAESSLRAIQQASLAYARRHSEFDTSSRILDADYMVECCLDMTEEVVAARFAQAGIIPFGYRLSGAGRNFGRLITQQQMEAAFGYLRPPSKQRIEQAEKLLKLHQKPAYRQMRQSGAEFMGTARNLASFLDMRFNGSLYLNEDSAAVHIDKRWPKLEIDPESFSLKGRGGDKMRIYPQGTPGQFFRSGDKVHLKITGLDLINRKILAEIIR